MYELTEPTWTNRNTDNYKLEVLSIHPSTAPLMTLAATFWRLLLSAYRLDTGFLSSTEGGRRVGRGLFQANGWPSQTNTEHVRPNRTLSGQQSEISGQHRNFSGQHMALPAYARSAQALCWSQANRATSSQLRALSGQHRAL